MDLTDAPVINVPKSDPPNSSRLEQSISPGEPTLPRWVPVENRKAARESTVCHPVILKLALLSQGLKVSPEAASEIGKTLKIAHAVGAVGKHALDIILDPGKVYVGLPVGAAVSNHLTEGTPFTLEVENGKYFIGRKPAVLSDSGRFQCVDENAKPERLMSVTIPPYPHYYDHKTSRNHSMRSIMPLAGDFGGATIFPHCHYFGRFTEDYKNNECRFCGIDENLQSGRDIFPKRPEDFLETVAEARKYPYFRHGPVFAGGTTPPPDRGAKAHAKFLRPLKDAFPDNWLRLTIAPPEHEKYIDMLFEAGADLVGFNYEIYDPLLFAKMCPGKVRDIEKGTPGHAHYDRMLNYMIRTFGRGHASANLIAGLEPAQSTVNGIAHLASMGAIPTIFVFVPLKDTALEYQKPPSIREMIYIYSNLKEITERFGADTYCAGCNRMLINTKYYDGLQPTMPEITEDDLQAFGLPTEDLQVAPRVPHVLALRY
jgi:hypothetical protein